MNLKIPPFWWGFWFYAKIKSRISFPSIYGENNMKTLKNGDIAFYRLGRMIISGAGVMGWLVALIVLYFIVGSNKQVFYIVLPVLSFMMIVEFLVIIKFILPPVIVVSPQGIELSKKKHTTIFWDQITAVYRQKGANSMGQLVFETAKGPVHTVPLILANEDQKYLFRLLQEHNLSVQERCL